MEGVKGDARRFGTLYASSGRLDEAEGLWRRALALKPDYVLARENLERLEVLRGSD